MPLTQFGPRIEPYRRVEMEIRNPTNFQRQVQIMKFKQFENETNIKDVIREIDFNGRKQISDDTIMAKVRFYFKERYKEKSWHTTPLKFLEIIQSDNSTNTEPTYCFSTVDYDEPTDFQKQIMAMDFQTFCKDTNAEELAKRLHTDQNKETTEFTEERREYCLKQLFTMRRMHLNWNYNIIKYIKINKRNSAVRSDVPESQGMKIQYNFRLSVFNHRIYTYLLIIYGNHLKIVLQAVM